MRLPPLITAEQLAASQGSVAICDIRWDLEDPEKGRATYELGHIPGAVFVDLDEDLSGPAGLNGRHPLPQPSRFAETLGRLGISPSDHVVAYDDVEGRIAARLWWMLLAIGHENAQVLEGGYRAWLDSGHDVEVGTETRQPATYPVPAGFEGVVGHDQLAGRTVIDARAEDRYRGDREPVDPKAGHIPGAVNIPTSANLGPDGRFLDAASLSAIYGGLASPVMSCGSGVTACHDALAMVVGGGELPDVYVGSFSEWSRRDLPVNTGPDP